MKTLELSQEELYKLMISLSPHTELEGYRELQNKVRKAMGFPVGFEYDQGYDNVARLMMEAMQYENGMCDRYNREIYPDKWVEIIRQAAARNLTNKRIAKINRVIQIVNKKWESIKSK